MPPLLSHCTALHCSALTRISCCSRAGHLSRRSWRASRRSHSRPTRYVCSHYECIYAASFTVCDMRHACVSCGERYVVDRTHCTRSYPPSLSSTHFAVFEACRVCLERSVHFVDADDETQPLGTKQTHRRLYQQCLHIGTTRPSTQKVQLTWTSTSRASHSSTSLAAAEL